MRFHLPRIVVAAQVVILVLIAQVSTLPARADEKPLFEPDAYLAHVKFLASDELAGRQPGTEGIERAAEYIVKRFAAAGLEPAGEDGTWFQEFEVQQGKKLVDAQALLAVDGLEREWKVREDWIPLPFTALNEVEGPLAFAGYGIEAKEYEYNDYADFDAEGKVLLMFRYEPKGDDPNAAFGGKDYSRHSLFSRKSRVAARHGAKALLIVNPPGRADGDDALYPFAQLMRQRTLHVPLVHVSRELAEVLVKNAGLGPLAELERKLNEERKPLSADMDLNVHLRSGVKPKEFATRNVIGLLPGDGSTDEIIILGAHYDHLGRVPHYGSADPTPVIHNGADDNASGTAGILELARVLGREGGLRRNVLFISFSAEEMGLLGSKHFVAHPTVALKDVRMMINLDMIGRLSQDKFTIFGAPSADEFPELLRRAAERADVKYRAATGNTLGSDHSKFYEAGIPYLFPITGVHKQYHHPDDDWELIDAPGAARILDMLHEIVRTVADMEDGPTFRRIVVRARPEDLVMKPAAEHEKENLDNEIGADGSKQRGEDRAPRRPRVRLGIAPDFSRTDQPGLVADTVMEGGPAKAAGMKDGDRVMRIGEQPISDIYSYMDVLADLKPGQTVDVVVVRDGKEITLKVKLEASRGRKPGG